MRRAGLPGVALLSAALALRGASVYTGRIDDPKAVYLAQPEFAVHADGVTDDTGAIQAAIDKVEENTGEGLLFVPEGRYRITHTVYVWPGIRVIGYGAHRPVMVLADHTPGFQGGVADMFFYAGYRPGHFQSAARAAFPGTGTAAAPAYFGPESPPGPVPPTRTMPDANPGTFYSAMSNIDFEVGQDNAGAVAIRFHAAQHSYLAHIDFHMGSGLAGLHDIGNEAEDLHFYGGRYGILTRKPSPAWQFTLLDSTFEGQREAAIRENEAGLTLVHDAFRNVPTAVAIDRDYSDELWIKDAVFENISGPAIVISNELSRMTEINAENIVCRNVPTFARFRASGRTLAGRGSIYRVKVLSHGLTLPDEGAAGSIETKYEAAPLASLPAALSNVIAAIPPVSQWTNLRSLGAKGDGKTDDTAVIRQAIAEHRVIYLPMGYYVVSDTIALRPDTILIALHPDQTQLDLLDHTAGFQGPGTPRPLLEAPEGGRNIVTGIGLFTNGINSRAVGALWMASQDSLMDDVRFLGGHGTNGLDGLRLNPYNNAHTADPDIHRRWDAQYASLWVKGGGGTFANIWTPDTFATAGLYISDTSVPGRVFELSSEHHVRNEIMLRNAANWELDALQTEGESGESAHAYSLDIENSHDLTIANYHGYRVVRSYQPFPYAVRISHSHDIRFRNFHLDNNSSIAACDTQGENCRQLVRAGKVSFADAIVDESAHGVVRDREFAWLEVSGRPAHLPTATPSPVLEPGATVHKVADGFFNLSGGTADASGNLYFADPRWHRIYRWTPAAEDLTVVRDDPLEPVNLAFDNSGDLLVVSSGGTHETVYAFRPGAPDGEITIIDRQAAAARPGMTPVMPVDYWVNGDFSNTLNTETLEHLTLDEMFRHKMSACKPYQYVSPDKSVYIPANEVFVQGEPYFGTKWTDVLMPTGLVQAVPGQPFYVTNESDQRTYRGNANDDGTLSNLKVFAYQGGESLAQDRSGNVYIAAGQIYVYNAAGKMTDIIRVPDRPAHLVYGGKDRRTLFVLSHSSIYSVRTRTPGL
ncbi:MAG TPA: glycosyl hydrolase family 28-related protein [Bryobacteraceae bacterium]|nr:glycosyl hydrolase family 28-related protein [Bryobacteraceae bacterium]